MHLNLSISPPTGASGMIDLVFVIDASGSIRNERFPVVLNFITSIVAQLDVHPDRTRVGAIWFSDTAGVQFNLNQYSTRQVGVLFMFYKYTFSP